MTIQKFTDIVLKYPFMGLDEQSLFIKLDDEHYEFIIAGTYTLYEGNFLFFKTTFNKAGHLLINPNTKIKAKFKIEGDNIDISEKEVIDLMNLYSEEIKKYKMMKKLNNINKDFV
jgi:hypothetical protein